ncbi:Utp9p NDAI_0J02890 [Naumovozyma dairenensis CBS 421]|uniref:Small-subunit processome Utp12 domain-containing protein n=1 Tax=Naumovozyma dairenensis (strain ATCC 10597 / BCRC 20456 / CBS 421 / NBRC 0211 / NRRL Y-12639) TaxID=1071378 RepID=G0WHA3_NAUDC|nr:hypothetical protein NDAI_0J02890 [Naumovozyma dairenensis CBS 421]CCD27181.1 hypothetical protein NDAI_0J02890 [Naumovozyma dairenensis CBS 421]
MTIEPSGSFSPDASRFVIRTITPQKNSVDIYPLDASNGYKINSSLVSHLDYEANDLVGKDVNAYAWCTGMDMNDGDVPSQTKRKMTAENDGEDEENSMRKVSQRGDFLVNIFDDGKIVVFSADGKGIVNIIRFKEKLKGYAIDGPYIWLHDENDCLKKYEYNKAKPIKTFHLIEGKGDVELRLDSTITTNGITYLVLMSKSEVLIIDPTKRRPSTFRKYGIDNPRWCDITNDGKFFIHTIDGTNIFDLETNQMVQNFDDNTCVTKIYDDLLFCLSFENEILVYKLKERNLLCKIIVGAETVLDFKVIGQDLLIAWLNVNEPNFKLISLDSIRGNKEIILNEAPKSEQQLVADGTNGLAEVESKNEEPETQKLIKEKPTKAEQTELSSLLVKELAESDFRNNTTAVLELVVSEKWSEPKIKSFVTQKLQGQDIILKFTNLIVIELQKTTDNKEILSLWLKYILLCKRDQLNTSSNKSLKKNLKHLKTSLRISSETLPILLSMQGRLEMLKRQASLRKELSELDLEETTGPDGIESVVVNEGTEEDNLNTSSADIYVDATEF